MTEDIKPAPRFLGDRPRLKTVPLEWPIEYDGVEYRAVALVRVTVADVSAFASALDRDGDSDLPLPTVRAVDGSPLPIEVWRALDVDDRDAIQEEQRDFLPRKFRGVLTVASVSAPGETTA